MLRPSSARRRRSTIRGSAATTLLVCATLLSIHLAIGLTIEWDADQKELVTAEVRQGVMPMTIVAAGTLQCQTTTRITCEVYQLGDDDGTQILSIVPNGSEVKRGDLLFELDSSRVRERVEYYELRQIQYGAKKIQADTRLVNQRLQNKTNLSEAKQAVELSKLALEAYDEMTHAVSRLELVDEISRLRSQLKLSQAESELRQDEQRGIQALFDRGYRTAADLREAQLNYLKAQNGLEADTRKLDNALAKLESFDRFEHPVARKKLDAERETAITELRQVRIDNRRDLQERLATKHERDENLVRYDDSIKRYTDQVNNCQVYAPHDGFVVYDDEQDRYGIPIGLGHFVRYRETIMHLPDTSRMQVKAKVNESEYRHLQPGLACHVTVSALPDVMYEGTVHSVASVPQPASRYVDDVQVFEVLINLNDETEVLRPGMTSIATIDVDFNEPVVHVPIEAVCGESDDLFAIVDTSEGLRRQTIQIGESNGEMVEVRNGLKVGESVILQDETADLSELPILDDD